NRAAARDAADLLLSEGHSRIGIILDSLEIFTMRERLAGVEQAYQSAGLELDATLVTAQAHDPESTARAVRAMLDAPAGPTAFLAGNNRATVGIIEELFSAGRFARVVGFDDFETSHLMPRRTTIVDYDLAGLARDAATTLFRRIGGAVDAPEYHFTQTQLVERGLEQ
ncbi:MAG: substrate-binding domain-containing protein, partial [Rhodoglobus sp.]|nr:substrate-binding domain-containing protein [Rhodoglobus sp.]